MNARGGRSRAGFTAIEMIVVLAVICLLASMAGLAVVPAVRKGRINEATSAIVDAWRQARRLAMQRAQPGDDAHYGVVIAYDVVTDLPYIALIRGRPADADPILLARDGKPTLRFDLPAVASVWVGARELRDLPNRRIAWYAQYRTGAPMAAAGAGWSNVATEIGTRPSLRAPPTLVGTRATPDSDSVPAVVAPGSAANPGLSVRSADDRVRRAIAIYSSGISLVSEF